MSAAPEIVLNSIEDAREYVLDQLNEAIRARDIRFGELCFLQKKDREAKADAEECIKAINSLFKLLENIDDFDTAKQLAEFVGFQLLPLVKRLCL